LYGPRDGFIPNFLSWGFWAPLSKLSYSGYLVHLPLIRLRQATIVNYQHYTCISVLELWLGYCAFSFFAAVWIWLLVEAPFGTLSRLLLSRVQGKITQKSIKKFQNADKNFEEPIDTTDKGGEGYSKQDY